MVKLLKLMLEQAQLDLPGFFFLFELGLPPEHLLRQHHVAILQPLLVLLYHLDELRTQWLT